MTTKQPRWKRVANLGDVNPVEYGGYFVYIDLTGIYPPEAEYLESPDSDDSGVGWELSRVVLQPCKLVESDDHTVYLVSANYRADWPHPVHQYDEWFHRDLQRVADFADYQDIRADLCSTDPVRLANAYRAMADYHGWANFDSYPRHYAKRSELPRRIRRYNGR